MPKNIFNLFFNPMCIYVLPACICGDKNAHSSYRGQKRTSDLNKAGITVSFEPPCACWESNPGSLENRPVFLTDKLSLAPTSFQDLCFYLCVCMYVQICTPEDCIRPPGTGVTGGCEAPDWC